MKPSSKGKRFEPSVVHAVKPTAPDSPIAYVHKFLGRKINMALEDGRTLDGKLVALDWTGNFYLTGVQQTSGDSIFELKEVIVPFACIQEMSVLTPIQTKPTAAAKR